ncbi:hypothetical protein DF220_10785 [Salinibacterium hongtaonis]|uniref:HTH marR-type domain-containing protein n=2 Tax=Homoserinimonas hongtaonis TaxID=2079791 RepID=A0A2U1T318_9MICO|nr:hypothetical protein DF220_10785 [Salinibacterium hongtaonis]
MRTKDYVRVHKNAIRIRNMWGAAPDGPVAKGGASMSEADQYLSLSVRRVLQLHTALWTKHVSSDVSSVQYGVLLFLGEHGELAQRELMRLAQLDKSTLAELLRRMQTNGSITTSRDDDDKRRKTVVLTADGRALLDSLRPAALAVNDLLTSGLEFDDATAVDTLLKRLLDSPIAREVAIS